MADGLSGHDTPDELDALIGSADLDGLVRLVGTRTSTRDWAGLLDLRDRARLAVAAGQQLWPAAALAEFRLALLAPVYWAARVLDEDSGHFSIGPLTEVVAQDHTWDELSRLLVLDPRAGFIAHERVLRGEMIDTEDLPDVLGLPYELQPWEPEYALAHYTEQLATFESPPRPDRGAPLDHHHDDSVLVDDPDVVLAVRQLVEPWTAESNGRAEIVCVEGTVQDAVAALDPPAALLTEITCGTALQWLAWAGASGGAFGRRRGAALGRFGAWWLVAALGGATEEWPLSPHGIGELAEELEWYWWDDNEPVHGWQLQLAIESPMEGLAWAIRASDSHVE